MSTNSAGAEVADQTWRCVRMRHNRRASVAAWAPALPVEDGFVHDHSVDFSASTSVTASSASLRLPELVTLPLVH